jgi:uncharacterized MAPEG superfamily protein
MSAELTYLVWVSVLTMVLWVPYVLDRFMTRGIAGAAGYPSDPRPQSPWAQRLMSAHRNAVENLVVFAALILAAEAAGATNDVTAIAAMVYFWARLAHALVYALGIAWLRTLAFEVGFLCQAAIAWQLLS